MCVHILYLLDSLMAANIYDTLNPHQPPDGSHTGVCHFPREVVHILCRSLSLGTCSGSMWRKSPNSVECRVVGQGQMEYSHMTSLPVCFQGGRNQKVTTFQSNGSSQESCQQSNATTMFTKIIPLIYSLVDFKLFAQLL